MTSTQLRAPLLLGALVFAAACGDKANDDALKKDSTLGRDLALAGSDTAAKPQLADAPKAPPPAATRQKAATKSAPITKAAAPVAAKPTSGVIAAGTALQLASVGEVCTNTNKVGDTFTATVKDPVNGTNGAMIPAGAVVTLTATTLKRSENINDKIEMVFTVSSIAFGGKTYTLDGALTPGFKVDQVKNNPKGTTAKNVAGGAAVGAIAGQLLGKNTKATVVGAAVGAAAGAAAATAASNYEGCVRANTPLVVTLSSALTVPVA